MKYVAGFETDSVRMEFVEDNNKGKLIRGVRDMARGNRLQGEEARWGVWTKRGGRCVAYGNITDHYSTSADCNELHYHDLSVSEVESINKN